MSAAQQTLYVIVSREQIDGPTESSLARSSGELGINYARIIIEDVAFDDLAIMQFDNKSLLYRVSIHSKAAAIEAALTTLHPGKLTTIYQPKLRLGPTRRYAELFEQMAAQLPIIPTSIIDDTWDDMSDAALEAKVAQLNGFPVLFKTLGLSHGQGVQKYDTLASLRRAIAETLENNSEAILRKYLPEYRHFRLVVVDGVVAAVIEYHKPVDDFRTNAAEIPNVSAIDFSSLDPAIPDIAVRTSEVAGSILSGVDILVDQTDQTPYLAEVNVPCNFSRSEGPTGVIISKLIIEALLRKAASEHQQ